MFPETTRLQSISSINSAIPGRCRSSPLELIVGARNKKEVNQIDQLIAAYSAIPLTAEIGNSSYGLLREFAKSHGLRVFDSLIAATAIEENLTLVTKNKKHFQMIGNLKLEIPSN